MSLFSPSLHRPRRTHGLRRTLLGALVFGSLVGAPLSGQEAAPAVPPASPSPIPADSASGVSPGGAFFRSILVPGWGHLVTGSPTRGGFYFGSAVFNSYMLFKTQVRVTAATEADALKRREVEADLIRDGMDPDSIADLVDQDPRVQETGALVEVREQQMEDWIAWTVFMVLLGGADAFVSAHLSDFPAPLGIEARPVGLDGRVEVGISLGVQGPGG